MSSRFVAIGLLGLVIGGCAPPPAREAGFDDERPAALLHAIHRAGRTRDAEAVPRLIEALDHDDPAVRMMAILALERISGQRRGYNPYACPVDRRQAIERWVRWAEQRAPGSQSP